MKPAQLAALALALLAFAAAGHADRPRTAREDNVVHVLNWSEYIGPGVIQEFEERTGVKVVYEEFDSNDALEALLMKRKSGFDVVVPSADFLERQIKAGLFMPLDARQLPNLRHMDREQIMPLIGLHDPQNRHAIPYLWGTTGIGYNQDAVRKILGDHPLDSWRFVFDPKFVSRLAACGVAFVDAPADILKSMLVWLGRDPNSERPEDLRAAEQQLLRIRPFVREINSTQYTEQLQNGSVCVAVGWSGDIMQARRDAEDAGRGVNIRYSIPSEGAVVWFDVLAIPADARHPANAHAFINFLMEPRIAAANSNFVRYANGNAASHGLLDRAITQDPNIYPTLRIKRKLFPALAYATKTQPLLEQIWADFKARKAPLMRTPH